MTYGTRSFSYLLEEKMLQECGPLGKKETTDDDYYRKYAKWSDVPVPHSYVDPAAAPFHSPESASLKRTTIEQEGMDDCTRRLLSPTLLRIMPNQIVSFPKCPDHNFMIWANINLHVHRNDRNLRSFEI